VKRLHLANRSDRRALARFGPVAIRLGDTPTLELFIACMDGWGVAFVPFLRLLNTTWLTSLFDKPDHDPTGESAGCRDDPLGQVIDNAPQEH
jgi:hypothetical protein